MTRVAPVKLKNNHRTLWFDPGDISACKGDAVVVSTARGTELGYMVDDVIDVEEGRIKELKSPLKPVQRVADERDLEKAAEMERLSAEALPVFKKMAAETSEDMHPVSVQYLLDGDHAVFYFEAEERIDFRELVRKLASHFHVRVDMRQIGVRDEARMVGGLGHCGQELCCKRLGGEFCPVSIRMAKEQDLSLNPQKISGVCGRLMCCLRYEFDAYKEFKARAPKKNAPIATPEGVAKVADLDVPREIVTLKTEEGQAVKVPLASFDPPAEGSRPTTVGDEAWQEATAPEPIDLGAVSVFSSSQQLSGTDALARPGAVRHTASSRKSAKKGSQAGGASKKRERTHEEAQSASRKPRRRSRVSTASEEAAATPRLKKRGQVQIHGRETDQGQKPSSQKQQGRKQQARKPKPANASQKPKKRTSQDARGEGAQSAAKQTPARPGRKSSALRQHTQPGTDERGSNRASSAPKQEQATRRKPRRRSHRAHGQGDTAGSTQG